MNGHRWWALLRHPDALPVLFATREQAEQDKDPDEYLVCVEVYPQALDDLQATALAFVDLCEDMLMVLAVPGAGKDDWLGEALREALRRKVRLQLEDAGEGSQWEKGFHDMRAAVLRHIAEVNELRCALATAQEAARVAQEQSTKDLEAKRAVEAELAEVRECYLLEQHRREDLQGAIELAGEPVRLAVGVVMDRLLARRYA